MKKLDFYQLFYIFIFGSVFGWIIEGLWTLIKKGQLINHSALVIGPFNIAYGICAVLLTALLIKYKDDNLFKIFLIGFIGGSIAEYIMSWGMELVWGFTAWDYSEKFLNINGRISLFYSLMWGILGIFWIKYCYPFVSKIIDKMQRKTGQILIVCLLVFLLLDELLTVSAIVRARKCDAGVPPRNQYEKILDKTFNSKYLKNMFNNNWEKK